MLSSFNYSFIRALYLGKSGSETAEQFMIYLTAKYGKSTSETAFYGKTVSEEW